MLELLVQFVERACQLLLPLDRALTEALIQLDRQLLPLLGVRARKRLLTLRDDACLDLLDCIGVRCILLLLLRLLLFACCRRGLDRRRDRSSKFGLERRALLVYVLVHVGEDGSKFGVELVHVLPPTRLQLVALRFDACHALVETLELSTHHRRERRELTRVSALAIEQVLRECRAIVRGRSRHGLSLRLRRRLGQFRL